MTRRVVGEKNLRPHGRGIVPRPRLARERAPVGQGSGYVAEATDDHDIFAGEVDNRGELAHAIVHGPRVADRVGVEDVYVKGRDRVCHCRL